jgi:SAM-dependent methyltransferase
MNIQLIKRAFYIAQLEGWTSVIRKTYCYFLSKYVSFLATKFYENNSREYWNFRMKYDWSTVGGSGQTQIFAASLFANVDFRKLEKINSMLDYGCATGDSSLILKIFSPDANVYLYDLSEKGLKIALGKYERFLKVKSWDKRIKADLVYCSNVIEHVNDPRALVATLIEASNRYIIIQCPWEERHPNGEKIAPEFSSHEHIWTIDNDFFEQYIKDQRVIWTKTTGVVPMAWERGEQVYYLGVLV